MLYFYGGSLKEVSYCSQCDFFLLLSYLLPSSFLFFLNSIFDSSNSTSTLAVKFNVSLGYKHLYIVEQICHISWCFFERDNCNDFTFNHFINDCTVFDIDRFVIFRASKLNLNIYFPKDSLSLCFIPNKHMTNFFSFLLLVKYAIVSMIISVPTYEHLNFNMILFYLCHKDLIPESSSNIVQNMFLKHLEGRKIVQKMKNS